MDRRLHTADRTAPSRTALLRALHPDSTAFARWVQSHAEEIDWGWVVHRARTHKVAALVAARIEDCGVSACLAAELREEVAEIRRDAARRAEIAQRTLAHLSEHFARAGIPFFVVKGSVLAHHVYRAPTLRRFADVDIVVHRRDVEPAEAVLSGLGYRSGGVEELLKLRPRGPAEKQFAARLARQFDAQRLAAFSWYEPIGSAYAPVDLHWHIAPYRLRLSEEQVWERTATVMVGDTALLTLDPAATVIHLAAHATTCLLNGFRLLHLSDVGWAAQLLSDDQHTALWRLAREWRIETHLRVVFAAVQDSLGMAIPSAAANGRRGVASTPWARTATRDVFLVESTEQARLPLVRRLWHELAWSLAMRCMRRNAVVVADAGWARARFKLRWRWFRRTRTDRRGSLATYLRWRVRAPIAAAFYRAAVRHLSWWPLSLFAMRPPPPAAGPRRIAYYHSHFPLLSETFIQREVAALRESGLQVDVFSHTARNPELFDAQARQMMDTTRYIPGMDSHGLPEGFWRLARRHPLRLANVFLYVVFRQHTPRKKFALDRQLFNRAVYLAEILKTAAVTHVHSPWASSDATVAMLAARLADVRYSVQARASDIHRTAAVFGRQERLSHAAFVVTNTRYNEAFLRPLLPRNGAGPALHVIYNGIELNRFRPPVRRQSRGRRVLCVGRLVEPKGLEYLLLACKILRDGGDAVRCEIVGGSNAREINYYLRLKKLWRALGLESVVTLSGAQPFDRVLAKYEDADVFVLPAVVAADNRREITPNVLIEAMAMRLAVIGTPIGAIPEIIEDGVSGLIVPSRDEQALAAAIRRLLDDPALREELGINARRRIEERFDIRKNVRSYLDLFGGEPAAPRTDAHDPPASQRNARSVSTRSA